MNPPAASFSSKAPDDERGFFAVLIDDGIFPLALTGVALMAAGGFALFLCVTGRFLPHDVAYLNLDAAQLARASNRRLVNFMFHDRAAFGGSLVAIGLLYLWLAWFPVRRGEPWAWWTLAVSGLVGFGSFLTCIGYGYLDTWHGVATLFLLPLFVIGMTRAWLRLRGEKSWRVFVRSRGRNEIGATRGIGRALLLAYGVGLMIAGVTISIVGLTNVFVDTDLEFIRLTRAEICGVSDRLIPVIAHDRAGFGGGLLSIGVTVSAIVWHAPMTRSLRDVMLVSGGAGFASAIGVHFVVGYVNFRHLVPAFLGAAIFVAGWILALPRREKLPVPGTLLVTPETQKADAS